MQAPLIDNLQYANWSEKVFRQLRSGGVDALRERSVLLLGPPGAPHDVIEKSEDASATFD